MGIHRKARKYQIGDKLRDRFADRGGTAVVIEVEEPEYLIEWTWYNRDQKTAVYWSEEDIDLELVLDETFRVKRILEQYEEV